MEVKEERRPLWGVDRYMHFIVAGISVLNLIKLTPRLFHSITLTEIWSMLLSVAGLLSFWLVFKNKKGGELLMFIWSFLQLIIVINYPYFTIDLSQGYSLPISMTFEHSLNGFTARKIALGLNVIGAILTSITFFRLRNKNNYRELIFTPNNLENIGEFSARVVKTYSFGNDSKILILDHTSGSKSFAIKVDKKGKINLQDPSEEYLLCDIDTEKTKDEFLKPYAFKQLGYTKITMPGNM